MAKTVKITHEDVLSADELSLWRAVRQARGEADGYRDGAIAIVARRRNLDPDELNTQIADMKARLIDAGVVPAERFFVLPPNGPHSRWHYTSAPNGSRRCADAAGTDGVLEYESGRFAYNATEALNTLDQLDTEGRAWLAAGLREMAAVDPPETGSVQSHRELDEDDKMAVMRFRNTIGFHPGGEIRHGARVWTGPPAHAIFIAFCLETGTVRHMNGELNHSPTL